MFYRLRRTLKTTRFDRQIAGILQTDPLPVKDAPWCIVSMVAGRDVPMYLVAMKSFYRRLGRGKIVAIIDRDLKQPLRELLVKHLPGIEFVVLEDISPEPCQRGGTWERLVYCIDRSEREYTIQLDSDTLTVGDLDEVKDCIVRNRAFTMSDGFTRMTLREAANMGEATPSNYIGIATEKAFAGYEGAEGLYYIRGSSGFAGFAKGGFTRAAITTFHQKMEKLVGERRWREWGTEQSGSNFAIANSPDPIVLPYPEYASFDHHVPRPKVKLFHFIGAFRFDDGYFALRSQETISALTPGAAPVTAPLDDVVDNGNSSASSWAQTLTAESYRRYLSWRLSRKKDPVELELRAHTNSHRYYYRAPHIILGGSRDRQSAHEVFVRRIYAPPLWLPPETVNRIVDLAPVQPMSCVWWLANYWRAQVIAYGKDTELANDIRSNVAANRYGARFELYVDDSRNTVSNTCGSSAEQNARLLQLLEGQPTDILSLDLGTRARAILDDPRFATLQIRAVVAKWHDSEAGAPTSRAWCLSRLEKMGYSAYSAPGTARAGILWAYRR